MARLIQVTRTVTQTYYVRVTDAESSGAARKQALAIADDWGDSQNPITHAGRWRSHVAESDIDVSTIHITVSGEKR